MHASAVASRGRTVCSSHQARTLVSTLSPLWGDQWPLLIVLVELDFSRDCSAKFKKPSIIDVYEGVFRTTMD